MLVNDIFLKIDNIWSKKKTGGNWISFLQDNVRPHTARETMEIIRKVKLYLLPQPPYIPYIAPSAFISFIWETYK